jgi:hypothetical protein
MPVYTSGSYAYISTATTTVVAKNSGTIANVIIGGGTLGTIVIYDNTAGSGTIIASFDATAPRGVYPINASFATGLTVVTGAATTLTITWVRG